MHLGHRPSAGQEGLDGSSACKLLLQVVQNLTSENVKSCLQGLQASEVAAPPAPKRQKITRKTTQDEAVSSLPSDQEIDTVLRLYEGLMQSINAEQFLAVLAKPSSDEPSASAAPPRSESVV